MIWSIWNKYLSICNILVYVQTLSFKKNICFYSGVPQEPIIACNKLHFSRSSICARPYNGIGWFFGEIFSHINLIYFTFLYRIMTWMPLHSWTLRLWQRAGLATCLVMFQINSNRKLDASYTQFSERSRSERLADILARLSKQYWCKSTLVTSVCTYPLVGSWVHRAMDILSYDFNFFQYESQLTISNTGRKYCLIEKRFYFM